MDHTSRDMVEYLRQHNEQLMGNLLNNFHQKRTSGKLKDNLKKSQAESLELLKNQFLPMKGSTSSSLGNTFDKLFG